LQPLQALRRKADRQDAAYEFVLALPAENVRQSADPQLVRNAAAQRRLALAQSPAAELPAGRAWEQRGQARVQQVSPLAEPPVAHSEQKEAQRPVSALQAHVTGPARQAWRQRDHGPQVREQQAQEPERA